MIEKKLQNWIRNRLERLPSAGRFELTHQAEMGEEQTTLLRLEAGSGEGEIYQRAKELAEQILDSAQEHATAYEGRQRYRVLALERDTFDEIAIYVFALGIGGGMARSEPGEPTERGLLAQLMRHNQQLAHINVEQSQAVNQALIAENRDLRGRVEKVEAQRAEWFELLETMHSSRHERELSMMQEAQRAETREKAIGLLMRYVPEVLKKLDLSALSPSPSNDRTTAQLPAAPSELERAQATMRRVWRILDRDWISGHLDEQNRTRVDQLLGIGDPLKSMAEFSERLTFLWGSLSDEVTDRIQEQIVERDSALATELLTLMGSQEEAAE